MKKDRPLVKSVSLNHDLIVSWTVHRKLKPNKSCEHCKDFTTRFHLIKQKLPLPELLSILIREVIWVASSKKIYTDLRPYSSTSFQEI